MIWLVVCLSLYFLSCVLVMSMVSFMGMLTHKSLMSSVISLCLSLIVSFVKSLARLVEFCVA
jgi:hypothetical protein